nr:hypothetical protein [uncultured Sphingomonas sp.]
MSRANSDLMDMIHGLVATGLSEELARAIELAGHEDPEKRVPLNPQLIDKCLKFLKDNGIDAPKANKKVDHLAGQLADLDLDQEAMRLN